MPFNSLQYYNNNFTYNVYEYLLQEYSLYQNIFGNFDLINNEKEKNLINFGLSCNFDIDNLKFVINRIIENENYDNIKLYYLIILKQIICTLYNSEILDEGKIKALLPYFKNLILKNIKSKEKKIFNKMIKEIIVIISFIENNTILEINEIKFVFEESYNDISYKTKLLLIELLLEQKKTQKEKELYEIIIQIEKNYLMNIFKNYKKNNELELKNYSLMKYIIIKSSEVLFKVNESLKNELINLILVLSNNIQEILELYKNSLNCKNKNNKITLDKFSLIYNSFIFRAFYLIILHLLSTKALLKDKKNIFEIYKIIIILDKFNINTDFYDMNNKIEIKNILIGNDNYNFDYFYFKSSKLPTFS